MKLHIECSYEEVYNYLTQIDPFFSPPLSFRVDLQTYAEKLETRARVYAYIEDKKIAAAIFYYVNNKAVYIPVLGCTSEFAGQGLMLKLVKKMEKDLVAEGMSSIALTTWFGSRALNFYIKNGFVIENIVKDRPDGGKTVYLRKNLKPSFSSFSFLETPIEVNDRLNDYLGVNLMIKRDDLFPVTGGGSKARKLKYILKSAIEQGCTAIVTAGSNYSNHLRATAVLCSELGLKFTACIHDQKPNVSETRGNVKLTLELAHRIHFVPMTGIKRCMDDAIIDYISEGERPFYIWGGGHCIEGTVSYMDAVEEMVKAIDIRPQHLFTASGTGTTQAGLLLGASKFIPKCQVIGISVARNRERGRKAIIEAIEDVSPYLPINPTSLESKVFFDDNFLFGGYGKTSNTLIEELNFLKRNFGLILDPVYSGKSFFAIKHYIDNGIVARGSDVLFWNTGGIVNALN